MCRQESRPFLHLPRPQLQWLRLRQMYPTVYPCPPRQSYAHRRTADVGRRPPPRPVVPPGVGWPRQAERRKQQRAESALEGLDVGNPYRRHPSRNCFALECGPFHGWGTLLYRGSCAVDQPPPSALIRSTLASILRRMMSMPLRSLVREVCWAVTTCRYVSRPPT
jgi:hypothetical protein